LKRQVPGGQVKLTFSDGAALQEAAGHLESFLANSDTMTLVTPTDGSVASLRALLDRLDGIAVDSIAMDEPGLDDVFFSLTGRQAETEAEIETAK
jgi:ABC-2 type transport system ATP-binding protein